MTVYIESIATLKLVTQVEVPDGTDPDRAIFEVISVCTSAAIVTLRRAASSSSRRSSIIASSCFWRLRVMVEERTI